MELGECALGLLFNSWECGARIANVYGRGLVLILGMAINKGSSPLVHKLELRMLAFETMG